MIMYHRCMLSCDWSSYATHLPRALLCCIVLFFFQTSWQKNGLMS